MTAATHGPIRTPDQRLRVFVSSTLEELAPERAAVQRAIEQLHLIPVLFELGARPHPPRELYRAYLAQSHVFLGLYWQRYGWVAPGETISGLEDEFVLGADLPRLLYVKHPSPDREPRLVAMLQRLREEGTASYRRFSDPEELERLVLDDLAVLLTERFEGGAGGAAAPPGATRTPVSPPPVPLTTTVGRERDVDRVAGLLRDGVRLLTLSGPGGIGKSRLALEVAGRVATMFPDGVAFVPLETVSDPDRLLPTVRERLHLPNPSGRPDLDVLVDGLAGRRMLLLLDNFEQLADGAPRLGQVLDLCPGISALVTSRQVLRLRAEHEHPVAPLASGPAVDLFVQRAAAARPDFHLDDAGRAAVVELCRRLDGLPLALELAAARVRLLPPAALLERLEQRLDLLSSGAADLPERQRTMRATLDWSHRLLDEAEQALLARLSVFVGGATLEAVEGICGDEHVPAVLETLSSLLEKSLLVSIGGDGGQPRLQQLQVVRDYAAERLAERGEADELRRRHGEWYARLVEPCDVAVHEDAHDHFHLIEADLDNLRAAGRWASAAGDLDLASTLVQRTWACAWMSSRLPEVLAWLEQLYPMATDAADPTDLRTRGIIAYFTGELRFMLGDSPGALEPIDRALAAFLETGDARYVGVSRLSRAIVLVGLGRLDGVAEDTDAAFEVARSQDNGWLLGYAASVRGTLRMVTGDHAGARADHELSLATAARIGHVVLEAQAHGQLAWLHLLDTGNRTPAAHRDALRHLRQQVSLLAGTDNLEGLGYALDAVAGLALAEGRVTDAGRALGASAAVRGVLGMPMWPLLQGVREGYVCRVHEELGEEAAHALIAEGAATDPWTAASELLDRRSAAMSD